MSRIAHHHRTIVIATRSAFHRLLLHAALAGLTAAVASAQSLARIEPGSRVRVLDSVGLSLTGSLVRQSADTVVLRGVFEDRLRDTLALSIRTLREVELSTGSYGHGGTGALVGILVGGFVGYSIGSADKCGGGGFCFKGVTEAADGLLGAAGGVIAGAIIGHSIRSDFWESVWVAPASGSTRIGIRRRF